MPKGRQILSPLEMQSDVQIAVDRAGEVKIEFGMLSLGANSMATMPSSTLLGGAASVMPAIAADLVNELHICGSSIGFSASKNDRKGKLWSSRKPM
jgi:hypothetical protein